jgi:hypothetical protein
MLLPGSSEPNCSCPCFLLPKWFCTRLSIRDEERGTACLIDVSCPLLCCTLFNGFATWQIHIKQPTTLVSSLKDKLENALNEARILLLGGQVLIGAGFRLFFAEGLETVPLHTQIINAAILWLMTLGMGVLLLPAAYHFIVERGENTSRLHELLTSILEWALFPFALGLGASVFTVAEKMLYTTAGAVAGLFTFLFAVSIWYLLSVLNRKKAPHPPQRESTKLSDKIKEALIEARMILPGAQALLGFQVANALTNSFDQLPRTSQWAHLLSLICIAVSTVFLITPAAYHRIAEHGEDSEGFYLLCGRLLLVALFWLGLGLSADLWIVVRKVSQSDALSNVVALTTLVFSYGLWFGYSLLKRRQEPAHGAIPR